MEKKIFFVVVILLIISSLTLGFFVSNNKVKNNDISKTNTQEKLLLTSKTWTWVKTQYNDDKLISPKQSNKFTITFKDDGNFNITTDCNGGFGSYKTNDNKIEIGQMGSTMMFCEGSQEGEFTKSLSEVSSYFFTKNGELVFDLKLDSGSILFK